MLFFKDGFMVFCLQERLNFWFVQRNVQMAHFWFVFRNPNLDHLLWLLRKALAQLRVVANTFWLKVVSQTVSRSPKWKIKASPKLLDPCKRSSRTTLLFWSSLSSLICLKKSTLHIETFFFFPTNSKTDFFFLQSKKRWFFGDLSTEEAKEVLNNQPNGTFLIRFSSKGCFAASFVTQGAAKHVLIMNEGTTKYTLHTGEGQETLTFSSFDELINYYYSRGVFTQPYVSNRRLKVWSPIRLVEKCIINP